MALVSGDIARAADVLDAIKDVPIVKGVRITNAGNPIGTTPSGGGETNLSHWALTGLTLDPARLYVYRCLVTWTKTASGDTYELRLRANTPLTGSLIGHSPVPFGAGATSGWAELAIVLPGDASWTSLHLSVARAGGSGTLSWFGATASGINRGWAWIEHTGRLGVNWSNA